MSTFEENINTLVRPHLDRVESARLIALAKKKQAVTTSAFVFLAALAIGIIIASTAGNIFPVFFVAILGIIISAITYNVIAGQHIKNFEYAFKTNIVANIAKALQPDVSFSPYQGISEQLFKSCNHYRTGIDRYSSEDLFQGKIGATEILFSELHAEYESTSTDSDGNTTTTWHTIFKGVMFIADFHKNFRTWVIVKPDAERDGFFGWFNKTIQSFSSNLVKLENPEFETHFKVHGGDPIETRYILTPDMQERLLSLRQSLGSDIIISFQRSNVYITAPKDDDYFEPDIHTPAHSHTQINTIARQIHHYFRIVDTLNLNTRIWTKE